MGNVSTADWEALVAPYFRFLEERFHMRIIGRDDSGWWETSITYARDPVAVIVRNSVEFNRAEIELVRMVDGKIPPVPIFVHPDTRIDRCEFDNLLILRAPSEFEALKKLGGLDRPTVERSLEFQASALERYAPEFLRGDPAVFEELDKLIKDRVAENPQRIKISFPEGTSPQEIERGVADAKRIDPKVPVDVQFYNKPPSAKRRWKWAFHRSSRNT